MASIHVVSYVIATVNGRKYEFGSLSTPTALTAAGNLPFEQVESIAQNTTKTLFSTANDLANFDFLLIASDQDVLIELTCDRGNEVGDEYLVLKVLGSGTANVYGVPLMFSSDFSRALYTSNFAAGTDDVIDQIRARNTGATTANVLCMAFT